MQHALILLGAGCLAGAMNALAGGGSFVTLAALIAAGVPSVAANASSTVALYPAGAASAWVYRGGLGRVGGVPLRPALAATMLGGFAGALLLLATPDRAFDRALPWLLLAATATLAAGPRLGGMLRARFRAGAGTVLGLQAMLGIYGGYFGGGGAVDWEAALLVGAGALAGGFGGAHLGRRAPARLVRAGTVALACALTALFFARAYAR